MMLIVEWSPVLLALVMVIALRVAFRRRTPRRLRDESSTEPYVPRHYGKLVRR